MSEIQPTPQSFLQKVQQEATHLKGNFTFIKAVWNLTIGKKFDTLHIAHQDKVAGDTETAARRGFENLTKQLPSKPTGLAPKPKELTSPGPELLSKELEKNCKYMSGILNSGIYELDRLLKELPQDNQDRGSIAEALDNLQRLRTKYPEGALPSTKKDAEEFILTIQGSNKKISDFLLRNPQ